MISCLPLLHCPVDHGAGDPAPVSVVIQAGRDGGLEDKPPRANHGTYYLYDDIVPIFCNVIGVGGKPSATVERERSGS